MRRRACPRLLILRGHVLVSAMDDVAANGGDIIAVQGANTAVIICAIRISAVSCNEAFPESLSVLNSRYAYGMSREMTARCASSIVPDAARPMGGVY